MDQGPEDPKASLGAEGTQEPRAAQAATAPRGRRETLALRVPGVWPERLATKEPRETEACLDPEALRGLSESLGRRDLGETPATLVPVESQDSLVPRGTPAGLDSATRDPEECPERRVSPAHPVLRGAEVTLVPRESPGRKARRASLQIPVPLASLALGGREDPQDPRESLAPLETPASRSATS